MAQIGLSDEPDELFRARLAMSESIIAVERDLKVRYDSDLKSRFAFLEYVFDNDNTKSKQQWLLFTALNNDYTSPLITDREFIDSWAQGVLNYTLQLNGLIVSVISSFCCDELGLCLLVRIHSRSYSDGLVCIIKETLKKSVPTNSYALEKFHVYGYVGYEVMFVVHKGKKSRWVAPKYLIEHIQNRTVSKIYVEGMPFFSNNIDAGDMHISKMITCLIKYVELTHHDYNDFETFEKNLGREQLHWLYSLGKKDILKTVFYAQKTDYVRTLETSPVETWLANAVENQSHPKQKYYDEFLRLLNYLMSYLHNPGFADSSANLIYIAGLTGIGKTRLITLLQDCGVVVFSPSFSSNNMWFCNITNSFDFYYFDECIPPEEIQTYTNTLKQMGTYRFSARQKSKPSVCVFGAKKSIILTNDCEKCLYSKLSGGLRDPMKRRSIWFQFGVHQCTLGQLNPVWTEAFSFIDDTDFFKMCEVKRAPPRVSMPKKISFTQCNFENISTESNSLNPVKTKGLKYREPKAVYNSLTPFIQTINEATREKHLSISPIEGTDLALHIREDVDTIISEVASDEFLNNSGEMLDQDAWQDKLDKYDLKHVDVGAQTYYNGRNLPAWFDKDRKWIENPFKPVEMEHFEGSFRPMSLKVSAVNITVNMPIVFQFELRNISVAKIGNFVYTLKSEFESVYLVWNLLFKQDTGRDNKYEHERLYGPVSADDTYAILFTIFEEQINYGNFFGNSSDDVQDETPLCVHCKRYALFRLECINELTCAACAVIKDHFKNCRFTFVTHLSCLGNKIHRMNRQLRKDWTEKEDKNEENDINVHAIRKIDENLFREAKGMLDKVRFLAYIKKHPFLPEEYNDQKKGFLHDAVFKRKLIEISESDAKVATIIEPVLKYLNQEED